MSKESINAIVLRADDERISPKLDRGNRYEKAEVLARLIANANAPYSFCINGKWGSGKTVFMHWIEEILLDDEYHDRVDCLWFDAWKYESLGNLIIPLISEFNQKAVGKDFTKIVKKIEQTMLCALVLGGAAATLGALSSVAAGTVLSAASSVGDSIKVFKKGASEAKKQFKQLNNLNDEFKSLVEYVLVSKRNKDNSEPQGKKMIIFIDDLDRCLPDKALALFESIKNFLWVDNCIFVFGMDVNILEGYIKERISGKETESEAYLNKVIKYIYDLPFDPFAIAKGLAHEYASTMHCRADDETLVKILTVILTDGYYNSFRDVKRLLNQFAFYDSISRYTDNSVNGAALLLVAIFLYDRFPENVELYYSMYEINQRDCIEQLYTNFSLQNIESSMKAHYPHSSEQLTYKLMLETSIKSAIYSLNRQFENRDIKVLTMQNLYSYFKLVLNKQ